MKAFLSLLSVYVKSTYNPRALLDLLKQGPKGVAKAIGLSLLILYAAASFGFIMLVSSYSSYVGLEPLGLQSLVLLNGVSSATAIVIVLGFVTCLATYFMSEAECVLQAMPIPPRAIFGSKFAMTYLSEAALAVLMIASSCGVYAFFERPHLLFYVYFALIALATPLLPLSLFYFLLVPLMTRARFLRRKDTIIVLGGAVGIALAITWQLYNQKMMLNANDPAWLLANLSDPGSVLKRFAAAFPPALFAARALERPDSLSGLGYLAAFMGSQAGAAGLCLLCLPGAYARSLVGFNESYLKRMKSPRDFIERNFRPRSGILSFFLREWRQMNREPVFFLNGPFIVFLMPLLLGVIYGAMKKDLLKDLPMLAGPGARKYSALGVAGIVAMLGAMNGIACTSISREGPQFAFLKSLPLRPAAYFGAKLLHGLCFALIAAVTGPLLVGFLLPLTVAAALRACFAGFGFACLLNVLGLWLDTANPKLSWPNPTVAMKQNPNYAIVALGGMGLAAGYCVLISLFQGFPLIMEACGAASLALAAACYAAFLPYARKRFALIED